jgi:hypothetical protein
MNVPEADGVPLIVITFEAHAAVTPAGSPVGVPIPVAPVVVLVMAVSAVLIQTVGLLLGAAAVLLGVIVTTCVVVAGPLHPAALAVIVVVPLHVEG